MMNNTTTVKNMYNNFLITIPFYLTMKLRIIKTNTGGALQHPFEEIYFL